MWDVARATPLDRRRSRQIREAFERIVKLSWSLGCITAGIYLEKGSPRRGMITAYIGALAVLDAVHYWRIRRRFSRRSKAKVSKGGGRGAGVESVR